MHECWSVHRAYTEWMKIAQLNWQWVCTPQYKKKFFECRPFEVRLSSYSLLVFIENVLKCPVWVSRQPLQETDSWDPALYQWGCLSWFPTRLASIAVAKCGSAGWDLFMVDVWQSSTTLSPCSSGILEWHVSETMDRRRWISSMACSFLWFKSLRFFITVNI